MRQAGEIPISIWVHGASLGDVHALRALTKALHYKGHSLTLSASTLSGQTRWHTLIASQFFTGPSSVQVCKAPLLSRYQAQRCFKESKAQLLILELLEVWPAWIKTWTTAGAQVVVVDGRISPPTLNARFLLRSSFTRLSLFLAQTSLDASRAIQMGCSPDRVHVCGDAKVDSLLTENIPDDRPPKMFDLILGCIRPKDERPMLLEINSYLRTKPNHRILIAPRHLERITKIQRLATKYGLKTSRLSTLKNHVDQQHQVCILDGYGMLAQLYYSTHCAIIGGTFFDRGQNLIEAARAGCGVIYGPKLEHQRAQAELVNRHGGHPVSSWHEAMSLALVLQDKTRKEIAVNFDVLHQHTGVVRRQLKMIEALIFSR
jgi:3-deoxy-D-manno-octulosonic-acid transferase